MKFESSNIYDEVWELSQIISQYTEESMTCPWLSTRNLLLDHARFSQDLQMSHSSPLTGRSHWKWYQAKCVKKSIPQRSMHVEYVSFTPLSTFRDACPWLQNGHLLLDLYHDMLSQYLHGGHGPLQWAADTGKHKCYEMVILLKLEFLYLL